MGADFIDYTPYLLPLTAIFLLVTLAAFAYRVRERRGFWPFAVGSVAAVIVLIGKFAFDSDVALNAGITLLVAASLWNAWPKASAATVDGAPVRGASRGSFIKSVAMGLSSVSAFGNPLRIRSARL